MEKTVRVFSRVQVFSLFNGSKVGYSIYVFNHSILPLVILSLYSVTVFFLWLFYLCVLSMVTHQVKSTTLYYFVGKKVSPVKPCWCFKPNVNTGKMRSVMWLTEEIG